MTEKGKEYKQLVLNALLAGFMIGLGCVAYCYTSTLSTVLASFLFSLGLLSVITQEHHLYTGKIGYAGKNDFVKLVVIYVVNVVSIVGFCLLFSFTRIAPDITAKAIDIATVKTGDSLISLFILGIGCGMMMYLAVDNYKKAVNPIFVILPIMFFILCGFEHCIADAGYFALAHSEINIDLLWTMLAVTGGNSVGSIILHRLKS